MIGGDRRRHASVVQDVGGSALRTIVFVYVGMLVALPLLVIVWRGVAGGPAAWKAALLEPIAHDALLLSAKTSALAAILNGVLGTLTAWALVRSASARAPSIPAFRRSRSAR